MTRKRKRAERKKVSTATCEPSLNFRQICLKGPSWLYTRLLLSCKVPNGVSNGLLAPTSDLASRLCDPLGEAEGGVGGGMERSQMVCYRRDARSDEWSDPAAHLKHPMCHSSILSTSYH